MELILGLIIGVPLAWLCFDLFMAVLFLALAKIVVWWHNKKQVFVQIDEKKDT